MATGRQPEPRPSYGLHSRRPLPAGSLKPELAECHHLADLIPAPGSPDCESDDRGPDCSAGRAGSNLKLAFLSTRLRVGLGWSLCEVPAQTQSPPCQWSCLTRKRTGESAATVRSSRLSCATKSLYSNALGAADGSLRANRGSSIGPYSGRPLGRPQPGPLPAARAGSDQLEF